MNRTTAHARRGRQLGRINSTDVLVVAILAALLSTVIAGVIGLEAYGCRSRWSESGVKSDYRLPGGCMVQRKDGTWWPEAAIRDVGQ